MSKISDEQWRANRRQWYLNMYEQTKDPLYLQEAKALAKSEPQGVAHLLTEGNNKND